MRVVSAVVVVVTVSLSIIACGNWSPPLPTAPSDSSQGATISGTVRNSTQASATPSRLLAPLLAAVDALMFTQPVAASNNVTVSVVGTSIMAPLSGSGTFVLNRVPSGNIQLRFNGPGVDATVTIHGVQPEHIKIAVTLNGSNATVDSVTRVQMHGAAEVQGAISSISHGDRSMRVNGIDIKIWDAPIYSNSQRVGITELNVGQRVSVKGNWVESKYVVATEVQMGPGSTPPSPPPSGGAADVDGLISSISYGDRSMKVNGIEIKVWDAPIFRGSQRVGITELTVGQRVGVKGTWVESKYIVATEVQMLQGSTPAPSPPPSGGYAVEGPISSISYGDRSMKLNGIEVKIWDAPVYRGSQRVGITELGVGQRVGVKGNWVENKYIVATEVFIL